MAKRPPPLRYRDKSGRWRGEGGHYVKPPTGKYRGKNGHSYDARAVKRSLNDRKARASKKRKQKPLTPIAIGHRIAEFLGDAYSASMGLTTSGFRQVEIVAKGRDPEKLAGGMEAAEAFARLQDWELDVAFAKYIVAVLVQYMDQEGAIEWFTASLHNGAARDVFSETQAKLADMDRRYESSVILRIHIVLLPREIPTGTYGGER